MKPDGALELDLSHNEERVVVKILGALMVTEPGENWIEKKFRWTRDSDPVPGWEMVSQHFEFIVNIYLSSHAL